jgi:tRNA(fMet)-specific endonuclease VapC
MAVLIDADVLIEGERGRFDLIAWLERQAAEEFALAAITVAELWHGVERADAAHRTRREQFVERIVATFEVVTYTESTAREHARLWAQLEMRGVMVGAHDQLLAATAMERGDAVATFNARHFSGIPNLRVIEPT